MTAADIPSIKDEETDADAFQECLEHIRPALRSSKLRKQLLDHRDVLFEKLAKYTEVRIVDVYPLILS